MKANEMPEKIYIFDYNDAMVTPIEGDTVYVREDAFIEKVDKYLKCKLLRYIDDYKRGVGVSTEEFVDNFVNYIKGE